VRRRASQSLVLMLVALALAAPAAGQYQKREPTRRPTRSQPQWDCVLRVERVDRMAPPASLQARLTQATAELQDATDARERDRLRRRIEQLESRIDRSVGYVVRGLAAPAPRDASPLQGDTDLVVFVELGGRSVAAGASAGAFLFVELGERVAEIEHPDGLTVHYVRAVRIEPMNRRPPWLGREEDRAIPWSAGDASAGAPLRATLKASDAPSEGEWRAFVMSTADAVPPGYRHLLIPARRQVLGPFDVRGGQPLGGLRIRLHRSLGVKAGEVELRSILERPDDG
jgi:hypothetical protein